ncbi:MAG: response regulator [Myxococcota bacterium]|nr:response regulator [Myxococcota bacterium]
MHRVLIADDAPFMRQTLREIIEPLGYEVVAEACSGLEAVELFALYQPDIAVVDMVMPRASGLDTVRMILNRFPAARIVMASALGQELLALDALAAGALDFISKPYQLDSVELALAGALEKPAEEPVAAEA